MKNDAAHHDDRAPVLGLIPHNHSRSTTVGEVGVPLRDGGPTPLAQPPLLTAADGAAEARRRALLADSADPNQTRTRARW